MKRSVILLLLVVATVLSGLTTPAHATRMAVDEHGLMPGADSLSVAIPQQIVADRALAPITRAGDLWQAGQLNSATPVPDHWQLEATPSAQRPALSGWVTPSEPTPPIVRTLDLSTMQHQPDPALAPLTLLLLASGLISLTVLRQQQPA